MKRLVKEGGYCTIPLGSMTAIQVNVDPKDMKIIRQTKIYKQLCIGEDVNVSTSD